MIRSVALTLSVITNRVWAVVWFLVLSPQLATTFGGSETLMVQTIAGLSGWMGWVIPLILDRVVARARWRRHLPRSIGAALWRPRTQRHPQGHAHGPLLARLSNVEA